MDILFINDIHFSNSVDHPQIGQQILKNILCSNYSVECINFDYLNKEGLLSYEDDIDKTIALCGEYILQFSPKIVGFYTICNSFIFAIQIAEYIKNKEPGIKIILGGPHASLTADECLKTFSFVDAISVGESELTIEPLAKALLENTSLNTVKNVVYRDNGEILHTQRERLLNNEELGEYTVFDYSPFKISDKYTFELEGGRGCPFGCSFCSTSMFWGRKYRVKPVQTLISEMNTVNKMYGITSFAILHDMFTANRTYITKFCSSLKNEGLNYKWTCSARADSIDHEMLIAMKDAGCTSIYMGIETGSQERQAAINKNLDIKATLSTVKDMLSLGFDVTTSFIFGYPNETIEQFCDTVHLMEQMYIMGAQVQLHRFAPLPNTVEYSRSQGKMFFNEQSSDLAMYYDKYYTEKSKTLIKNHVDLFSQYYIVKSEIDDAYPQFDLFALMLSTVSLIFKYSIRYTIEYYGLQSLYFKLCEKFDMLQHEIRHVLIHNKSNEKEVAILLCDTLVSAIDTACASNNGISVVALFKYEKTKYEYFANPQKIPGTFEFDIDIERFINHHEVINQKTYIRFCNTDGDVKTSSVSGIHQLIQKYKESMEGV